MKPVVHSKRAHGPGYVLAHCGVKLWPGRRPQPTVDPARVTCTSCIKVLARDVERAISPRVHMVHPRGFQGAGTVSGTGQVFCGRMHGTWQVVTSWELVTCPHCLFRGRHV